MIFSLKWPLEQKCRVSYILKTDEDCYVNIWNLLHWLRSYHEANGSRPLYAGRVQTEMPVVRDTKSRYYVSEEDHPADIYKPYASGGGYVISASLLPALVNVSRTSPIFANEDALLGSLMYRIGIQWTDNQKFLPLIFCSHLNKYRFRDMHMCGLSRQIILHGIRGRLQLEMHFNSALYNHFPSLCSSHTNYEDMRDVCEWLSENFELRYCVSAGVDLLVTSFNPFHADFKTFKTSSFETFKNNQEPLWLVIISFILMTLMLYLGAILRGEFKYWSIWGVKGFKGAEDTLRARKKEDVWVWSRLVSSSLSPFAECLRTSYLVNKASFN